MHLRVRDRVPSLTAALSVVSLALVFGAATGAIPAAVLPRAPESVVAAIPHVNAAVSALAILAIVAGVAFARRGEIGRHRTAMLSAFGLFALFLALYLYRVVVEGTTAFAGPAAVRRFVYLPTLAVHVLLAIVCIPLLYYVALVGLTHPVEAIPTTRHRTVGRVAAVLWLVSFVLGIVVYALLYVVY